MQACSDLAHVVLVLVGVRRVTVVHIGHEGVLVIIHFCIAILFVNCCIRRCFLYNPCLHVKPLRQQGAVSCASLGGSRLRESPTIVVKIVVSPASVELSMPGGLLSLFSG